ncbi:MAG: sugar phosphate nucleotidyltransferase, partial [Methylocella sp.]
MSSFLPAKAMVFAAGLGTRMRPLTDRVPKPLVAVAGKPLIDHALDRFAMAGVETAIVNVHYLADQIEAHLAARKAPRIVISDEREKLLDQGGGIAKALPLLGPEPCFV